MRGTKTMKARVPALTMVVAGLLVFATFYLMATRERREAVK